MRPQARNSGVRQPAGRPEDGPEDWIIRKIHRARRLPKGAGGVRVGIGDDAALFQPRRDYQTILTCDWFLEGAHFRREKHPADSIGWKCLARAVSDVAAMGGEPRCFLLSLAIPATRTGKWLSGFLAGLRRAEGRLNCVLAGGDTTRSKQILIHISVVGEVRRGKAVLRSGARPGDIIFVSGHLGEAELGLRRLLGAGKISQRDPRLRKHLYPEPRLELGAWLANSRLATAMMDLSDGLSTDLARLCAASGVGAKIEQASLPLAPGKWFAAPQTRNAVDAALHGGDDYELLFTVSSKNLSRVPREYKGLRLTQIGGITRERWIRIEVPGGGVVALKPGGWDPFRARR